MLFLKNTANKTFNVLIIRNFQFAIIIESGYIDFDTPANVKYS